MGKEYTEMTTSDLNDRVKNFQKHHPEFLRKYNVIHDKEQGYLAFLEDYGILAIEYSNKCPEVIVAKIENGVKYVS